MTTASKVRAVGRHTLPRPVVKWLRPKLRRVWPPVGLVRFGSLRRLTPISRKFGDDRGLPIDRHFIEDFLRRHGGEKDYILGDIRGHVLEVGDECYAPKFGVADHIRKVDVLHVDKSNPQATLIGDLARPGDLPADTFDCIICTQAMFLIYDVHAVVESFHRALRPGGVVLATVPGISQICRPDVDLWGDHWRFTSKSLRRLFEERFPAEGVTVEAYGNVLTAISFLHGLATEELRQHELDLRDPDYEQLLAVRAVKER